MNWGAAKMLNTATTRSLTLSGYLFSIIGVLSFPVEVTAQQVGVHNARLGFASTALNGHQEQIRLTRSWNASDNADTIWLVVGKSQTIPVDSIRLFVLADQALSPSSGADSTVAWLRVPSALLNQARGERNIPASMMLLAVFNPSAVSAWMRRQFRSSATRTLLAAEVWRRNSYERAQLFIDGSLDRRSEPIVVPQPARASGAPARK
jgi:hypothetical protein